MNHNEHIRDPHPATACPENTDTSVYASITTPIITDITPTVTINDKGLVENDVTPSSANVTIFPSGYFDSPATLTPRL